MSDAAPSLGRPAPASPAIHAPLAERWSPRAFSPEPVAAEDLAAIFEAARWAPSCFNEQPWRFLVAVKDDDAGFERLLATLVEGNREWARHAPVLAVGCAAKSFARNGKPNAHARHDLGQAMAMLSIEAAARGLAVHQMAGFDAEAVARSCGLPEDVEAVTAFTVGRVGDPDSLPEALAERERAPRSRKPRADLVHGPAWGAPSPAS